jgi:hypothetical protein
MFSHPFSGSEATKGHKLCTRTRRVWWESFAINSVILIADSRN